MRTLKELKATVSAAEFQISEAKKEAIQVLRAKRIAWEKKFIVSGPHLSKGGRQWWEILPSSISKDVGIKKSDLKGRSYLSDLEGRALFRKWSYEGYQSSGDHWASGSHYCFTIQSAIDDADPSKYSKGEQPWPSEWAVGYLIK
jgi:hypothetical protein